MLGKAQFNVDVAGDLDQISPMEKASISDELTSFLERYKIRFNDMHLHVYLKVQKAQHREMPEMYCSLNLTTNKGRWNASETGWGSVEAVHKALGDLKFQIDKKFSKMEVKKLMSAKFKTEKVYS